jgi:hypothetical protein
MRPFRVVLEGSWTPEKWADFAGFFATRIVLARGPDEAADIATRRLLNDLPNELPGSPEPQVRIDAIYEAEAEDLLEGTPGFTFYPDAG